MIDRRSGPVFGRLLLRLIVALVPCFASTALAVEAHVLEAKRSRWALNRQLFRNDPRRTIDRRTVEDGILGDALSKRRRPMPWPRFDEHCPIPKTTSGPFYDFGVPLLIHAQPKPVRARSAFDRAMSLQAKGDYVGAIEQGEQALTLLEDASSGERLMLARCLGLLGKLYSQRGDFARSESFLARALAIYEAGLFTNHPEVADLLGKLAILYQTRGLYGRAEPLHQRALVIQEALLGKEHGDVAVSLNNLATLYTAQGLDDRAGPLLQRALAIQEASPGDGHPELAVTLLNLSELYRIRGQYGRSQLLAERALAIQEEKLGGAHPDVALSLISLAGIYRVQGRAHQAGELARRALAIQEASLGPGHPLVADSLSELAALHHEIGFPAQAEKLTERALAIREDRLGERHPAVAASLNDLAVVRVSQGRLPEAVPLLTRAFTLSEERLRREALDFSEARLAGFLQYLRTDEERLHALLRANPEHPGLLHLALTATLLWKGRSARETANTSRLVYRGLEPQDRETFDRLRELRSLLAQLSLEGARDDYQALVKELMSEGDALEAGLAKRSARLRALTALPSAADIVDRTAAALPEDGVLVELVAYTERQAVFSRAALAVRAPGRLRYQALVLSRDARIQVLDLGPAAPIDTAAARLRDALGDQDAGYEAPARALQDLVFQPLRPLLGRARNIYLSPDGQISLVPFAALLDDQGFLGDRFSFTYLTSGKDLLPDPMEIPRSRSVVVFADPAYHVAPGALLASVDDGASRMERSYDVDRVSPTMRSPPRAVRWEPLPGTRHEAEMLQRLLPQAHVLVGPDATKDRLLHVVSPGVLHVATHGFFLEDEDALSGARTVALSEPSGQDRTPLRSADPLLRSGLVLAGARAAAGGAAPGLDRTVVTALEMTGLDLWGTQLVVLSACDTGRGDIKLGQGVYGLRRALAVAGAETVVMSLWKVDDETTRFLMEAYYRGLLSGEGRTAALRHAMDAVRQRQPHPHFWAPFISLGRDTPIARESTGVEDAPVAHSAP